MDILAKPFDEVLLLFEPAIKKQLFSLRLIKIMTIFIKLVGLRFGMRTNNSIQIKDISPLTRFLLYVGECESRSFVRMHHITLSMRMG